VDLSGVERLRPMRSTGIHGYLGLDLLR
jgi:hypothetical protein